MTNTRHEPKRDPEDILDRMVRPELRWEAPQHLTANLLNLIPATPALMAALPHELIFSSRPQPKRWYVVLVTILTFAAIAVSLLVAWDLYSVVGAELGLPAMWDALIKAISNGVKQLSTAMPQLTLLMTMLAGVRTYLYWLLLVAVLWAVLDGWTPSVPFHRQQVS